MANSAKLTSAISYLPRDRPLKAAQVRMSSNLRIDTAFESTAVASATYRAIQQLSPTTRENLSIGQVYSIAREARSKLGREADRADHNLRRMVCHANMLDLLMEELLDSKIKSAEGYHEVIDTIPEKAAAQHIHWIDPILDQLNRDDTDSDTESDDGSDTCDEDDTAFNEPLCRIGSHINVLASIGVEKDRSNVICEDTQQICAVVATLTLTAAGNIAPEHFTTVNPDILVEAIPRGPATTPMKSPSALHLMTSA